MDERIYGLDTGGYDPEMIENLADWELYLLYYGVTYDSWWINHYLADFCRRMPKDQYDSYNKKYNELQYPIQYLLYVISKRNGIEVNEPAKGKTITPDRKTFMRWYSFYNDFYEKFSKSDWEEFEKKREEKADISAYLPKGDWKNYKTN